MSVIVISLPATARHRAYIATQPIFHVTDRAALPLIQKEIWPAADALGDNCTIHLTSQSGWSGPKRFLRDYSVVDAQDVFNFQTGGRYVYFFVGEPNWWGLLKNIGYLKWERVQAELGVIRIRGQNLVTDNARLFYRPDDRALVLSGEYRGPACVYP